MTGPPHTPEPEGRSCRQCNPALELGDRPLSPSASMAFATLRNQDCTHPSYDDRSLPPCFWADFLGSGPLFSWPDQRDPDRYFNLGKACHPS